jgi:uncharacterized protein YggT (Ycf19 family)
MPRDVQSLRSDCLLNEIQKFLIRVAADAVIPRTGGIDMAIRTVVLLCTFETVRA